MTHDLKTWPEYYARVADGAKTFEVRKNDRDFSVGDFLALREFDPSTGEYTGNSMVKRVAYILHGGNFGIEKGYIVMSILP
jgi:hypothetical protein